MKQCIYLILGFAIIGSQISCDGFTKLVDIDYSAHEAKGVVFSLLTNTDDRDTAFSDHIFFIPRNEEPYANRIYISNSYPPGFSRNRFYQANIHLSSNSSELSLQFIDPNDPNVYSDDPYYSVEEDLVPGQFYSFHAEFDPDLADRFIPAWQQPISAMDTMPQAVSFELENATLVYPRDDLSPDGGYVDIVVPEPSDRNHTFQVAVSAILNYTDGQGNYPQLVKSYIEQPVENIDTELFGYSRYDVFNGEEFTIEGRKRIRFDFRSQFGPYTKESPVNLLVRLTTMSDHYAKFIESSDQYSANDGNPFVEPVEIYTNIENGYGIFALGARSYGQIEVK